MVLNYQADRDTLYYASAAKGFRPGGINSRLPNNCFPDGVDPAKAMNDARARSLETRRRIRLQGRTREA